jgi:hypothetical protein
LAFALQVKFAAIRRASSPVYPPPMQFFIFQQQ